MKLKEVVFYFEEGKHKALIPLSYLDVVREYFPVISSRTSYVFPPSPKLVVDYLESLYYLLAVGTNLSEAFLALMRGNKNPLLKGLSLVGYLNIIRGERVFEGFEAYFEDKTPVRILQSGEQTQNLLSAIEEAFKYLREMSETKGEFIKKLIYPITILIGSVGVTLFTTLYALPNLKKSGIYAFVKGDKTVKLALDVVNTYAVVIPYFLLFMLITAITYTVLFKISPSFQRLSQKIPLLNSIFLKGYYVGFRTVASGVKVGMSLSEAFLVASEVAFPKTVKEEFLIAKTKLEEGKPFSDSFRILSDVERTLINNAVKSEFLEKSFSILSERMKKLYLSRLKMIPPVIYAFAVILGVSTSLSLIGSVIIPYLKMIKGLSQ